MAGLWKVFSKLNDSYLWCCKGDLLASYGKSPRAFPWVSVEVQQKLNEADFKHCLQQKSLSSYLNTAGEGFGMDH